MALSSSQKERYARQINLPGIGMAGQRRLLASRVLLVGLGGLGSPAGYYLAAAGIGTLGLLDGDILELSNLQRQIAHGGATLGRPKTESAARAFQALNPDIRIQSLPMRLTAGNARPLFEGYDFIVDATDNYESKYIIADACHAVRKPYSYAGIVKYSGQTMTVIPGQTACLLCLFGDTLPGGTVMPDTLGVVPGVIGAIQATETIKYLLGLGGLLTNRLLTYDAMHLAFRTVSIKSNPACCLCGAGHT